MTDEKEFEIHKVVIAAAVAAAFGTQARVRQIRAVNHPVTTAWARQGRILVQQSHNLAEYRWKGPGLQR